MRASLFCALLAATAGLAGYAQDPKAPQVAPASPTAVSTSGSTAVPPAEELPAVILGVPDTYIGPLNRAMEQAGLRVTLVQDIPERPDLSRFEAILLDVGATRHLTRLRPALEAARGRHARVVGLSPGYDAVDVVSDPVSRHPAISEFRAQPTTENMARFLRYVAVAFLGRPGPAPAALHAPDSGVYHPDAPGLFASLSEYEAWRAPRAGVPAVGILVPASNVFGDNTGILDALIHRLEPSANVAAWYGDEPPPFQPDVWITLRPFGSYLRALPSLNAPVLQAGRLMDGSLDEWSHGKSALSGSALNMWVTEPESVGVIEPTAVGCTLRTADDIQLVPIDERISRLATRAIGWARLRRTPNADKRIALVQYRMGAAYLNVPRSVINIAAALKANGYRVAIPDSAERLTRRLQLMSRVGTSANDLARLSADPDTIHVAAGEYLSWFHELPSSVQTDVTKWWGPPPGNLSVHKGEILIPRIRLGNLAVLALPPRSDARREDALYHSLSVPPTHAYIAFYLWLTRGKNADAVIHLGTHGTLEFLPKRADALGPTDYPDLLMGDLPNINPYNVYNAVEAVTARRRGRAVAISHNIPALRAAQLSPPLRRLSSLLNAYRAAEDPALKAECRRQAIHAVKATPEAAAAAARLKLSVTADRFDALADGLTEWMEDIQRQELPDGLHTFGEQPRGERLVASAFAAVREDLEGRVNAVRASWPAGAADAMHLVQAVVRDGRTPEQAQPAGRADPGVTGLLQKAGEYASRVTRSDEVGALVNALAGGFIPSGPGGDPTRNLAALPTGRNIHALDPARIPSTPAWALGRRLANDLLRQYQRDAKRMPRKIGFTLFGGETIRHQGVMESEALYLLGVEPVWSVDGRVNDLRLIPASELGRPRIDVAITATGQYRDVFGDTMRLLQRAVDLAANAPPEAGSANYVRENVDTLQTALVARGKTSERARRLASMRVFAPAAGVYGAIEGALGQDRGPASSAKLAGFYTRRMGFSYGQDDEQGSENSAIFSEVLKGTDAAVFSRTGRLYGLMDADEPFGFFGGMSLAVKSVSGRAPKMFIANMRSSGEDGGAIQSASAFMATEIQSRYLNPQWIQAMQKEGASGAREMRDFASFLFGWQSTAPQTVDPHIWRQALDVYARDKYHLKVGAWMSRVDPEAFKSFAAAAIRAAQAGHWTPSTSDSALLSTITRTGGIPASTSAQMPGRGPKRRGVPSIKAPGLAAASAGHPGASGGSPVRSRLRPPGPASKSIPVPPTQTLPLVHGQRLVERELTAPGVPRHGDRLAWPIVLGATGLFVAGFRRGLMLRGDHCGQRPLPSPRRRS